MARRSIRRYRPEPIPAADLTQILEPGSGALGRQPAAVAFRVGGRSGAKARGGEAATARCGWPMRLYLVAVGLPR
jgi:hypothetical protein